MAINAEYRRRLHQNNPYVVNGVGEVAVVDDRVVITVDGPVAITPADADRLALVIHAAASLIRKPYRSHMADG